MRRTRIGEMLVQQGRLDAVQLQSALAHQRQWGGRLGRAIVTLGFLQERELLDALGVQLGVPVIEIGDRFVPPHVVALVPERLVRARRVFPIARLSEARRGPLVVALSDPADLGVLDEISFATGMEVKPALASDADLDRAIARHYGGGAPAGSGERPDAIELPDDDAPPAGRGSRGGDLH